MRPNWDFKRAEGKERLRVYRPTLMAGLRGAAKKPTNLAKLSPVRQQPNESPAAFLERIMKAFRQYTPIDPQADESRAAVMLAFVNQAASDIKEKLQKIERLNKQSLQDLVRAAERDFNHRETPVEREDCIRRKKRKFRAEENHKNQKELAQIFFAGVENKNSFQKGKKLDSKTEQKNQQKTTRCKLEKNQCVFCKEFGHWKDKCPKKNLRGAQEPQERDSLSRQSYPLRG